MSLKIKNSNKHRRKLEGNYKHYSMLIQWSDEDQAYLVTVLELPGCITHGCTYEEAIKQGQEAIETWIEGALAINLPFSSPQSA